MNSRYQHVIQAPRIVLIFWGDFYQQNPQAVSDTKKLVTEIVTGRYMNGLAQYGVGRGSVLPMSFPLHHTPEDYGQFDSITPDDVADNLMKWINNGTVWPAPEVNEKNLVYLILAPTETTLLDEDDNGIKAYHHSSQYHESSAQTDLFWALIGTRRFIEDEPLTDGAALVQAASVSISHELAETFSDRDSAGFRPQTASQKGEISDLCKGDFYFYGSFQVQKYWSIWSTGCIHGNDPVSLRQFLKSISFDTAHHGLRSLGMATLNLESIASQMRSLAPAGMV